MREKALKNQAYQRIFQQNFIKIINYSRHSIEKIIFLNFLSAVPAYSATPIFSQPKADLLAFHRFTSTSQIWRFASVS
jgi:hypothetical protein